MIRTPVKTTCVIMRWAWNCQLDDADAGGETLAIVRKYRDLWMESEQEGFGSNRDRVLDECCSQSAGGGGRERPRISEDSARFRARFDPVIFRPTANHIPIAKADTEGQSNQNNTFRERLRYR